MTPRPAPRSSRTSARDARRPSRPVGGVRSGRARSSARRPRPRRGSRTARARPRGAACRDSTTDTRRPTRPPPSHTRKRRRQIAHSGLSVSLGSKVVYVMGDDEESVHALEQLYRSRYPRFLRLAYAVLGSRDAAADAVQEAFVRALHRRGSLRDPGALEPWVWRTVLNVSLSQRAARLRPLGGEPADAAVVSNGHPDEWHELRAAVAVLPERSARCSSCATTPISTTSGSARCSESRGAPWRRR